MTPLIKHLEELMIDDSHIVEGIPYLNRYALKLTKNRVDAEDLVSMTTLHMIETIRQKPMYIEKPRPYMARVMYHLFILNFCQKKATSEYIEGISSSEPQQETKTYLGQVLQRARRLENPDKKIIWDHINGLSPKEISDKHNGYRTSEYSIRKTIRNFQQEAA